MTHSDEELAAQARAGDERAFAELVGRHLNGVYSFALRFVGSSEEAQDISQEVWLKAWRSLAQYREESARFKTWLMRIARNASVDFLRKKKHVPFSAFDTDEGNMLAEGLADEAELPDELLARAQDAAALAAALKELSPAHREVLVLHYTNALTFGEIGSLLNTPQNTIKSRHRRALGALREILLPRHHSGGEKRIV